MKKITIVAITLIVILSTLVITNTSYASYETLAECQQRAVQRGNDPKALGSVNCVSSSQPSSQAKAIDSAFIEMQAQVDMLNIQVAQLNNKIAQLQNAPAAPQAVAASTASAVSTARIEAVEVRVTNTEKNLTSLQKTVNTLQTTVTGMFKTVSDLLTKLLAKL